MKLSRDEFEDIVEVARDYLQGSSADAELLAKDFAEDLVKLADDGCFIGLPCARHGGAVHGQEAEELRAGVEQILRNTADVREDEAAFVLPELRKTLIFLLDRVDARDSLAFREAKDVRCPECAGTGFAQTDVLPNAGCPACGGTGHVTAEDRGSSCA